MKILFPSLNILDITCDSRDSIKKISVAAFPLWSLQKQNGWVKRSKNNI